MYYHTEDFDDMGLETLANIKLSPDTLAVSLFNNKISKIEDIVKFLNSHSTVKAIWLSGNPIAENEQLLTTIEE